MRYFLDTEFNEWMGDLISLALVRADGVSIYLATKCESPKPWVRENVMPIIEAGKSPEWIAPNEFGTRIVRFLDDDPAPLIIADWPDDIRLFCQALITGPGQMVAITNIAFQMVSVCPYPTDLPGAVQHNAWWDAMALRHAIMNPAQETD